MRAGSTLILTMEVAGEDSSAIGINSRLRLNAGRRFSVEHRNSRRAGFFGYSLQIRRVALEHFLIPRVSDGHRPFRARNHTSRHRRWLKSQGRPLSNSSATRGLRISIVKGVSAERATRLRISHARSGRGKSRHESTRSHRQRKCLEIHPRNHAQRPQRSDHQLMNVVPVTFFTTRPPLFAATPSPVTNSMPKR